MSYFATKPVQRGLIWLRKIHSARQLSGSGAILETKSKNSGMENRKTFVFRVRWNRAIEHGSRNSVAVVADPLFFVSTSYRQQTKASEHHYNLLRTLLTNRLVELTQHDVICTIALRLNTKGVTFIQLHGFIPIESMFTISTHMPVIPNGPESVASRNGWYM